MSKVCGAFMPDDMSITCRLSPGNHPEHLGGFAPRVMMWENENYVPPSPLGDVATMAKAVAPRIKSLKDTGEIYTYFDTPPPLGV